MQSEVVSGVLKMGYRRDLVWDAVEQHLWEHDCGFSSWVKLVNAVLDLQEKEDRMRHSGPSQMGTLGPGLGTPQVHKRSIDSGEQYKSEQRHLFHLRLDTHFIWRTWDPLQPRELAKAGFFYTGSEDRVQCFCCKGILRNWEVGDQAMNKHHRHYPSCPFIRNFKIGRHYTDFLSPAQRDKLRRKEVDLNNSNDNTYRQPAAAPPPVPQAGRDIDPGEQYKSKSEQRRLDYMERHLDNNSERDMNEHSQHFSSFPSTRDSNVGDIPLSVQQSVPSTPPASQASGLYQPGTPQVHDIDPREHYKNEQRRLDSYATWPAGAPIQPQELAKAGFFYTGSDDRVQCFSCKGILRNWEVGDRAMIEHRRHFSSCPFVQNSNVGNVPIENQDPKYGDTAKGERERLHPHGDFVNGHETRNKPLLPPPGLFPVPVTPAAAAPPTPAGRVYTDFLSRAQQDKLRRKEVDPNLPRPPSTQQSVPSTLPASQSSGLYQPGLEKVVEDSMKCFYCEGELQNWEPEDEPWTEHAKWCKFLLQQRGDDYVQGSGVQARFPNLQAQEQHMTPPDEAGTGQGKPDLQFQSSLAVEMQSQIVSDVLEMGFEPNMVRKAVKQHVQDHSKGFASAHNLEGIVAVLHLGEKKEQRMEISGPSQMGTGGFRCHTHDRVEERLENGSDTTTGDATYHEDLEYVGEKMCKMCMEADVHIVFISCGHLTVSVCTYSFTMPPGLSTKCANGREVGFSP
ncbi:E3 ubiquitin-protein ligase XIAP-like [Branchiostoma floridae x Branchiostoma belcheri]